MINGFKVITLCGSTRFKEEFLEAQKRLTLQGNIVISVGLFGHSGDDVVWTEGVKDMLDRQHLAKIDLADEIFVINVGGYIGDSTRREIAYAEFKGKTIKYMENSKKASLYENYAALRELHDAGRISDEDFEKAGHDFDEKRKALIEEYNACQGPWPYQWKNVDAVVCGILQQMGVVSIDYIDLKDLYDADCVYEVRIKGKGANYEEQLQSIIDTIRSKYLAQLRSSKKVVVTLCAPSNHSGLLVKLADCMDGLNAVWQTRVKSEVEISIVYNIETELQIKLKKWSKETVDCYLDEVKRVGEDVATSFYNQSDLSRVKKCELMIIGINPGAGCHYSQWKLKDSIDPDFLYKGNPCFVGKSDEEILFDYYQKKDPQKRKRGWDLMKKIHKMLEIPNKPNILDSLDKFVLSNIIFFGTHNEDQIPDIINQETCAKKTIELIDILNPKVVLLLGDQPRLLFERITKNNFTEILAPYYHTFYSLYKSSHVISIYHTAFYGFYSNNNLKIIGNLIRYALDNPSKVIEKNQLESFMSKDINDRTLYLKGMINNNGAIQEIYDTILYHEYYTTRIAGRYVNSKDNLVIDLTPEEDKKQYVVLVFTRQNNEEKTKVLIKGIWPNEKFNPWVCDKSRHVHEVISFEESNEEIKIKMEKVLDEVKAFRDKEYPLMK